MSDAMPTAFEGTDTDEGQIQIVFSRHDPGSAICAAMHAHREAVTNKEGMAAAAERLNLPPFLQLHAGQTQGLSAGMKVLRASRRRCPDL